MQYFSLSFALNYFSLTALMVIASMSGNPGLAADIGMVHSVTGVLFLGLSANARNVILQSHGAKSNVFILMRSAFILPLLIVSVYICWKFHDVGYLLAGMLAVRRASEWLIEITLSTKEVQRERSFAKEYFLAQVLLFALVVVSFFAGGGAYFKGCLALWSVSPFVWLRLGSSRFDFDVSELRDLFPHISSTLMVGIGLYMFRGLLIFLVGKEYAGDLFSAFALGGIVPSIYGNVVGPALESENRLGHTPWAEFARDNALRMIFGAMLLGGAAIFYWSNFHMPGGFLGKSALFWIAIGLSTMGGGFMLLMQIDRTALLQSKTVENVFAPDLLMNLVIIATVPYAFYLFGRQALTGLFLWNGFVGWVLFKSYATVHRQNVEPTADMGVRDLAKYAIAALMIIPVFFQLGHGLFIDRSLVYDVAGVLKNLPIPVSVAASVAGILLLSNYRYTVRTLYLIFAMFVVMALSAAVSAQGDVAAMKAKIVLMIQYLAPWIGLILGRMFVEKKGDLRIIQRAFLVVVIGIAFPQLIISLVDNGPGDIRLRSYMYVFSIYQHFEYVPLVLCGAYLISLFGLYDRNRAGVITLSAVIGVYAFASTSRSAVMMLAIGVVVFLAMNAKDRLRRLNAALVLLSVLCAFMFNSPASTGKYLLLFANRSQTAALTEKYKGLSSPPRLDYWEYYLDRIEHGTKRNVLFGQQSIPDRATHPSAHNYYLDYLYNFGLVSLIPFLGLILYSLSVSWRRRRQIAASSSLVGLVFVLFFVVLVDNFVKVGLRQPYPGIFTFFLWGVLLRMLNEDGPVPAVTRGDPA